MGSLEFSMIAGAPCLDFGNSIRFRGRAEQFDTLTDYAAFLAWTREAGTLPSDVIDALASAGESDPSAARLALASAWQARELIFSAFAELATQGDLSEGHLGEMNRLLGRAAGHRVITPRPEGGFQWSWDVRGRLETPLWPVIHSAGALLTSPERLRVKQCDGSMCLRLFVDSSRNRRRRWCDTSTCGNRHRVREHYWRAREDDPSRRE